MELPSVEECQIFLEVINRGRVAAGLEPREFLDFDEATPQDGSNCLSARNLFASVPGITLESPVGGWSVQTTPEVAEAIGATEARPFRHSYTIPSSIRIVTDAFDGKDWGLRERMVEAGVVAP